MRRPPQQAKPFGTGRAWSTYSSTMQHLNHVIIIFIVIAIVFSCVAMPMPGAEMGANRGSWREAMTGWWEQQPCVRLCTAVPPQHCPSTASRGHLRLALPRLPPLERTAHPKGPGGKGGMESSGSPSSRSSSSVPRAE